MDVQPDCSTTVKPSKRPVVHSQTRKIVYNVYLYLKKNNPHQSEKKLHLEVADACGLSYSTVYRVVKEAGKSPQEDVKFSTPRKKRPKKKTKSELDDFDLCVVRRVINEFHTSEGERPTLKGILRVLKQKINYTGSVFSLRKVVRNLGFRWKKTQTNRKLLIEKSAVRSARVKYLRDVKQYRKEKRPIVYMDETYFHSSSSSEKSWSDSEKTGLKKPVSKGQRVIVVHAGGEMGFVPNALVMFKSGLKKGDYHDDMNKNNYAKWLEEKLVPNLQPNSVVVIDNAPYHREQVNPAPTSSSLKCDMVKWLSERGIPHSSQQLKPELYDIIKQHKPQYVTYKTDQILAAAGHTALRLPPYHPDLNPIEMIWACVKSHIKKKNVKFTIESVKEIALEKFNAISVEDWKSRCAHVEKVEDDYMTAEGMIDNVTERFIINLNDDSESDSGSDMNDDCVSPGSDDDGLMSGIEEIELPLDQY